MKTGPFEELLLEDRDELLERRARHGLAVGRAHGPGLVHVVDHRNGGQDVVLGVGLGDLGQDLRGELRDGRPVGIEVLGVGARIEPRDDLGSLEPDAADQREGGVDGQVEHPVPGVDVELAVVVDVQVELLADGVVLVPPVGAPELIETA